MNKINYKTVSCYQEQQKNRFNFTVKELKGILPLSYVIADIGCHRLDLALRIKEAGYDVHGFDISEFLTKKITIERSKKFNVPLCEIYNLEKGLFQKDFGENYFDAVLLSEVLEHLAFNPLEMWKKIFKILKPSGLIIITTPNSLCLKTTVYELLYIITRQRRGLSVNEIFTNVTFGHHWKEYCKNEIVDYFSYLGVKKEFINVKYVLYNENSVKNNMLKAIYYKILKIIPLFRPDLFVVVKLSGSKPLLGKTPEYLG